MPRKRNIRQSVLDSSRGLFLRHGYSKVTSDELAAAAGVSKRTLYQYFHSKEDLFREVMGQVRRESLEAAERIMSDEGMDFPRKLRELLRLRADMLSGIGRPLVLDVQRHFPDIWREVGEARSGLLRSYLERIIVEGVKSGFFRPDLDHRMFEMVYAAAVNAIVNPEALADLPYTAAEAAEAITDIVFLGVLSERGRELMAGAHG